MTQTQRRGANDSRKTAQEHVAWRFSWFGLNLFGLRCPAAWLVGSCGFFSWLPYSPCLLFGALQVFGTHPSAPAHDVNGWFARWAGLFGPQGSQSWADATKLWLAGNQERGRETCRQAQLASSPRHTGFLLCALASAIRAVAARRRQACGVVAWTTSRSVPQSWDSAWLP